MRIKLVPDSCTTFDLGWIAIRCKAMECLHPDDRNKALARHACGDWGDVTRAAARRNKLALKKGGRLRSIYTDRNGIKFWVVTDAHRSWTSVTLPQEY